MFLQMEARPDTEMTAGPCLDFNLCFYCSGAGEIALAVVESRRYKVGGGWEGGGRRGGRGSKYSPCCHRMGW